MSLSRVRLGNFRTLSTNILRKHLEIHRITLLKATQNPLQVPNRDSTGFKYLVKNMVNTYLFTGYDSYEIRIVLKPCSNAETETI